MGYIGFRANLDFQGVEMDDASVMDASVEHSSFVILSVLAAGIRCRHPFVTFLLFLSCSCEWGP